MKTRAEIRSENRGAREERAKIVAYLQTIALPTVARAIRMLKHRRKSK